MKRLLVIAFALLAGIGISNAQNVQPANGAENAQTENIPGPRISFEAMTHDYGTITKGGDGDYIFTFTNNGNEPLILTNVRASCGCTTPEWTQKPVMPGKEGTIKVHYNTNLVGTFNKSVTVQSNAVDNPRIILRINGNVISNETQE